MKQILDDPIIQSMEKSGFPPWMQNWRETDDDDFYTTHDESGYDREDKD